MPLIPKHLLLLVFLAFLHTGQAQEVRRVFTPTQLNTDIDVLQKALTTLHPGLYRYNSKKEIEEYFRQLRQQSAKPLAEKDFYLLVAKLAARIRCGHTYLNPLNMEENIPPLYMPKKVLPLCLQVLDRRFIITHNLSNNPQLRKGDEILSINGIPTPQIIDSLLLVSRTDGKNGLAKQLTNLNILPGSVQYNNLTDIFLPLFFRMPIEDFTLALQSPEGDQRLVKAPGVTPKQRALAYRTLFGAVPRGVESLQARMLNDSTAYLNAGTFAFYGSDDPFGKFMDSVFASLSAKPQVKHLILDIRTNEGGSGKARDHLLSYILPKDFEAAAYQERRCFSYLQMPEDLVPFLGKIDEAGFIPRPDSLFRLNEFHLYENQSGSAGGSRNFSDFPVKPQRFKGKVYLMTSPVNSSAGFEFAWIFQQYGAGTIVGEPTGGTRQGINGGNYFWLRLPYSRIEMDLPFIYQAHTGQPDTGILPDYRVSQTAEGIAKGVDEPLQFVLDLIEAKRERGLIKR